MLSLTISSPKALNDPRSILYFQVEVAQVPQRHPGHFPQTRVRAEAAVGQLGSLRQVQRRLGEIRLSRESTSYSFLEAFILCRMVGLMLLVGLVKNQLASLPT